MLEKKETYQVEITETNHVQVRRRTSILENGEEISSNFHRYVIAPGDDVAGETEKVKAAVRLAKKLTKTAADS